CFILHLHKRILSFLQTDFFPFIPNKKEADFPASKTDYFWLPNSASTQLLLSQSDETLRDFSTHRSVGPGSGVRTEVHTEFLSDFILQLVQGLGSPRNQQLVVVAPAFLLLLLGHLFHLLGRWYSYLVKFSGYDTSEILVTHRSFRLERHAPFTDALPPIPGGSGPPLPCPLR